MSEGRGSSTSSSPGDARPRGRTRIDPSRTRAFTRYSAAVLTCGVLASVGVGLWLPFRLDAGTVWPFPLLVLGFLLAEQLSIDVDVRQVGWTISFTEIPLVLGILTAPFEVVLAAHLIAGIGTQLGRRAVSHVAYNAGAMCWEVAVPFAVYRVADAALAGFGPHWVAAVLATLTSPLVSTVFGLGGLHFVGGDLRLAGAARLGLRTGVLGLLNSSVGIVGYQVASAPWGWALVCLAAAALIGIYRAYSGLLREQRDLEALSDFSLSVARSGQEAASRPAPDDGSALPNEAAEWLAIAERIRDQLNASRVVVHLRLASPEAVRCLVAGRPLPPAAQDDDGVAMREDPILQLPGTQVRYFRTVDAPEDVRDALRRRGVYEALIVPLRGANELLGAVEVHDRATRWRGFGRADVHLLRTLASHLATAVDNRRLLARLRHDAYHDPLTGLLNRPGFREVASEALSREPSSVVLRVDLEVLSTISDALGHAWTDRMVVAAGRRLREALGRDRPLARLEGVQFAALLAGGDADEAHQIAQRLQAELAAPYAVDRLTVEAAAVVGYVPAGATEGPAERDVDSLLRAADVAVRAARSAGDCVRGYVPSMGQIFMRRFQLVTQFRHALDSGQVEVHYQPKVALPSRQVLGVEALVRWRHPEFGRVDPDEFVPAVEATGLVDALTSFVMDRALQRVRAWLDRGLRMSAAVNLSVRNLSDECFPERVAEALARYTVPAELLTLELTESGVMADPARALPVLRRLHTMGVVLAVDDFGTGYSSLAYLRQLPVDEVKIDKSFVFGMGSDLGDMAVVRSIVELGHSLGLTVVAEGVEEDVVREQLVKMGCDVAQGYLISRPLSEDRFEAWLRVRTIRGRGYRDETVLTLVH